MKILAIRGNNLASLADDFAIDFQREPLASSGLFAICGPTGAGKSTLLDALCLALFDNTPRMRGADSRGIELPDVGSETTQPGDRRNLLRRGCAEGFAEIDFRGNDGLDYRARWSVRRARAKADGKLQQSSVTLVQLPEERPLGGTKTEVLDLIHQRIGLSFEQFTRAVLLAQNEFFTFLKAGEDERATLLQTLTGRDRFEVLSRRAFERNKREQEALARLRDLLALQQPLTAEARAAKDAERRAADAAIRAHAERQTLLERQLRWHRDLHEIGLREDAANAEWREAVAAREQAAARRTQLERVEAVQAARALHDDIRRLEAALRQLAEETAVARGHADTALAQDQAAHTAVQVARQHREALRAAALTFKPRLDTARELDAALASLASAHAAAAQTLAEAETAGETARQEQAATEATLATARGELTRAEAWLAEHARLRPLAEGWPRWDSLLGNAEAARTDFLAAANALQAADSELQALDEGLRTASAAHQAAARTNEENRVALDAATRAADRFDSATLSRRGEMLVRQHGLLVEGNARLDTLTALQREHAGLTTRCAALADAIAQATLRHDALERELPALAAALAEIEANWKIVFEASQANVEALREQLRPDAPCPVCGSHDHPYVTARPALDNALDALGRRRDAARAAHQAAQVERDVLGKDIAARKAQLQEREAQRIELGERLAAAGTTWTDVRRALAEAFAETLPDAQADALKWLRARTEDIDKAREAHARDEAAHRAAQEALKQARTNYDESEAQLHRAQETLAARQRLSEQAGARREAAESARGAAALRLNTHLDALEPMQAGLGDSAWRAAWSDDPVKHRETLERKAGEWIAQHKAAHDLRQRIENLETALDGARKLAEQASKHLDAARLKADAAAAALRTKRQARARVFAGLRLPAGDDEHVGRPADPLGVAEIEAALEQAAAQSATRLEQSEMRHKACAAALARAQSTLDALARRSRETEAARNEAHRALAEWIAAFNADAAHAPLDRAELDALLAHDAVWIAAERKALQALDTAVATAAGAASALMRQRRTHEAARPEWSLPVDDAPAALETALTAAREHIDAARTALGAIDLVLSQDDLTRRQSAELLAQIDAQEGAARIWAQMNELIGSADGKKFRNFAQQLTLDILIAYANEHLKDLARRYRLERVPDTLALMVVDQDMGDEHRSVHSLSGGESFLVSLALALGLASLSSHRVRVESLFIDEGFGSLDADTLRVAMDALDSLQSLGRKVGVISHVAEMTERIGTRIHVRRLPGGQSRVVVENAVA